MGHKIYEVIAQLEKRRIHFSLARLRPDSIMLYCTFPGLRLEIDVFEDGHIEYSRFEGDEGVFCDEDEMIKLIDSFI